MGPLLPPKAESSALNRFSINDLPCLSLEAEAGAIYSCSLDFGVFHSINSVWTDTRASVRQSPSRYKEKTDFPLPREWRLDHSASNSLPGNALLFAARFDDQPSANSAATRCEHGQRRRLGDRCDCQRKPRKSDEESGKSCEVIKSLFHYGLLLVFQLQYFTLRPIGVEQRLCQTIKAS